MQIKLSHCLLGLALVATAALAASPKFLRAPSASLGSPKVIVSWTEVGLGDTQTVNYKASAIVAARWQCLNRGNKCPSASNKAEVIAPIETGGTFGVDRNGRISGTLEIPAPTAGLVCPNGQVPTVAYALFTNITLTDTTNKISSLTNPSELPYEVPECP